MREVFVGQDYIRIGHYQSILDAAAIANFVREEPRTQSIYADEPLARYYPTLCIANDEDHYEAKRLLGEAAADHPVEDPDWHCPHCHEEVPGPFASCWQCGSLRAERDAANDADESSAL